MKFDIKTLIIKYRRVLRVARKPSKDEFLGASKICAIGMIIIGIIGFGIFIGFKLIGL